MNLYKEARAIAQEAWDESAGDVDAARDRLNQSCDGHEIAIYYSKAVKFCADHDTNNGESWLEDCGGIAYPGDTFGDIACRVAFATLLCAAESALQDIAKAAEESESMSA
jgi:hypothetical protein